MVNNILFNENIKFNKAGKQTVQLTLTHSCQVDPSNTIVCTGPFQIDGVSGYNCPFDITRKDIFCLAFYFK